MGCSFFIRNFTDSFLELGIGPNEVNVGKDRVNPRRRRSCSSILRERGQTCHGASLR